MASLAGVVAVSAGSVEDKVALDLARSEMVAVKRAILRFKEDTGHFPRSGPFALVTGGGSVPVPVEGEAWSGSPANLVQLLENPLAGTGHPLAAWDPERRRGWRGPYVTRDGEGVVSIGADLTPSGGSPTSGALLLDVPGVADPLAAPPVGAYLAWRSRPGGAPHARHGRPYVALEIGLADARLVGFGANGIYEEGAGDDLVLHISR